MFIVKYLKSLLYILVGLLISGLIITIFNYFNILNGTILKVLELFIPLISIFIGSYKLGKTSNQKGYIEGLKYSGIWVIIFLIFNIITKNITLIGILYLILMILIGVFASILGINKRRT